MNASYRYADNLHATLDCKLNLCFPPAFLCQKSTHSSLIFQTPQHHHTTHPSLSPALGEMAILSHSSIYGGVVETCDYEPIRNVCYSPLATLRSSCATQYCASIHVAFSIN